MKRENMQMKPKRTGTRRGRDHRKTDPTEREPYVVVVSHKLIATM